MEALLLSLWRLHPGCCCCIGPVRHLDDMARDAIKVSGVINAASPQLSPNRHTQQVGEQLGCFQLGAVSFGFLRVGQSVPLHRRPNRLKCDGLHTAALQAQQVVINERQAA
jgi:hypothetical protein